MSATDEIYENDVAWAETWRELDDVFSTAQLLEVLFAIGGYRSTSILINSAGVQLDANMADFRFPAELR